jgi:hypothetical protein
VAEEQVTFASAVGTPHRRGPKATSPSPALRITWAVIIAVGFIVRAFTSRGELWLDEILSLNLARSLTAPAQILFVIAARTDNNHPLNTLALYLLRDQTVLQLNRLPSVLCGTGSILLACLFARRWGNRAATFAGTLTASAFLFIHYSSEARGYAMQVFFTLLAMLVLDRGIDRPGAAPAITFGVSCILALLAHMLFLQAYVALLAWSAWRIEHTHALRKRAEILMLKFHAVPIAATVVLYLTFVRRLRVLGAPVSPFGRVLADSAALTIGVPFGGWLAYVALVVVGVILVSAVAQLRRRQDDSWLLFSMLCVGGPALVTVVTKPAFVEPRYFLLPAMGILLVSSYVLARFFDAGRIGKAIAIITTAAIVIGNSQFTWELLRDGRGHYLDALRYITAHTPGAHADVTGDHDFRHGTVVNFYASMLPSGKTVEYLDRDRAFNSPPTWLLIHTLTQNDLPSPSRKRNGATYNLETAYRSGPLAGWSLYLYRYVP